MNPLSYRNLVSVILLLISQSVWAGLDENILSCKLTSEMIRENIVVLKTERVETLVLSSNKNNSDFVIGGGGPPFFNIVATNIQNRYVSNLQDKSWSGEFDVVLDMSTNGFDANIKFTLNRINGNLKFEYKPKSQSPQLLQKSYGKCVIREGKLF